MDRREVEHLIIGAGLSGMMMGYLLKRNYEIIDGAPMPNFRTGAPFYLHAPIDWLPSSQSWKQIDVHHNYWDGSEFGNRPTIKHFNDYSRKILAGKISDTSLKFMDGSVKQGYVPGNGEAGQVLRDLHEEVDGRTHFGCKLKKLDAQAKLATIEGPLGDPFEVKYQRLISTMPLPVLLKMVGEKFEHSFQADDIFTSFYKVPEGAVVDAYQVIYITSDQWTPYRASLMGQQVFIESMHHQSKAENLNLIKLLWGFKTIEASGEQVIKNGKFHPIERTQRRLLLAKLTNQYDIYCLGRFAVWDYKRIDHIANDAQALLKIIRSTAIA